MDTQTGQIYRDDEQEKMRQARARGQTIVPVSEKVAMQQLAGQSTMTRSFQMTTPRKYQNRSKY